MTDIASIPSVEVKASDVNDIIVKLETVLDGLRIDLAIVSLLSLAIFLMNPKISSERLIKAVEELTLTISTMAMEADFDETLHPTTRKSRIIDPSTVN